MLVKIMGLILTFRPFDEPAVISEYSSELESGLSESITLPRLTFRVAILNNFRRESLKSYNLSEGGLLRGDCKPYPHNVKLVNF